MEKRTIEIKLTRDETHALVIALDRAIASHLGGDRAIPLSQDEAEQIERFERLKKKLLECFTFGHLSPENVYRIELEDE